MRPFYPPVVSPAPAHPWHMNELESAYLPLPDPQEEQLQKAYKELAKEYSELRLRFDYLRNHESPRLSARYLSLLGQLQYDELALTLSVRELILRRSLLQAYINRDQTPNLDEIEQQTNEFAALHRKILSDKAEALSDARLLAAAPLMSPKEAEEFRSLYLTLVKLLHPDLHPDFTPDKKELFQAVQQAYQEGDLEALRALYLNLDASLLTPGRLPGLTADLKGQTDKLRRKVEMLKERIAELEAGFPFIHQDLLSDPNKVKTEQERIRQSIEALQKQKEQLQTIVSLMEEYRSQGL